TPLYPRSRRRGRALQHHPRAFIQHAAFDHIKDALGAISAFQPDDIAIDGFIYPLDRANKIIAEYLHHNPRFRRNDWVDNGFVSGMAAEDIACIWIAGRKTHAGYFIFSAKVN